MPLVLERDKGAFNTLRGQKVRFFVEGELDRALLVDERAQQLDNFPHVESIYGGAATLPATTIEIGVFCISPRKGALSTGRTNECETRQ